MISKPVTGVCVEAVAPTGTSPRPVPSFNHHQSALSHQLLELEARLRIPCSIGWANAWFHVEGAADPETARHPCLCSALPKEDWDGWPSDTPPSPPEHTLLYLLPLASGVRPVQPVVSLRRGTDRGGGHPPPIEALLGGRIDLAIVDGG